VSDGSGIGISVGEYCQVLRATVSGNDTGGIFANNHCTISDCQATGNASQGIRTGSHCQVIGSTASGNTNAGIFTGSYSTVFRCNAVTNGGNGLQVGTGSKIGDCLSVLNRGHGVVLETFCTVQDSTSRMNSQNGVSSGGSGANTVRNCHVVDNGQHGVDLGSCCNVVNGCNISLNDWDGIQVDNDSHVAGNVINFNTTGTNSGAAIRLSSNGNRVEDNTFSGNDVGILSLGNSFIIRNHARNNVTNYHFVVTQNAGPIITSTGTITTNNPWANFSY
jgi:hypothetical protein